MKSLRFLFLGSKPDLRHPVPWRLLSTTGRPLTKSPLPYICVHSRHLKGPPVQLLPQKHLSPNRWVKLLTMQSGILPFGARFEVRTLIHAMSVRLIARCFRSRGYSLDPCMGREPPGFMASTTALTYTSSPTAATVGPDAPPSPPSAPTTAPTAVRLSILGKVPVQRQSRFGSIEVSSQKSTQLICLEGSPTLKTDLRVISGPSSGS